MSKTSRSSQLAAGQMGTALGTDSVSAYEAFTRIRSLCGERIENPDHFELPLAVRIMDGSDVHTIVELFLIAQDLQQFGDKRSIGDDIFLSEIGVGLADA